MSNELDLKFLSLDIFADFLKMLCMLAILLHNCKRALTDF